MNVFRKIRHNFLEKGRITQYLKYAIGEILLVVMGILIALQINNWNQKRINADVEHTYLLGLKEEFEVSKLKLNNLININQKNNNGAKKLLELTKLNTDTTDEMLFSDLLYTTFSDDVAFNSNNSLLFEMINSGNLKNLTNSDLRKQLTNWISTLEDITRQEEELKNQREKVLDIFRTDEYSLSNILYAADMNNSLNLPKPNNDINNLNLLDSRKFENNILMFILTSLATEKAHYQPLMDDLNSILSLINNELEVR